MVVPEKTSQVRKFIVPAWILKGVVIGVALTAVIATVMVLDYWFVMNQITELKQAKAENRRLRQQVQVFKSKMSAVENTMERVKTFSTRLKVITGVEDKSGLLQSLNQKPLPDSATNIGQPSVHPSGEPELAPLSAQQQESGDPEDIRLRQEQEEMDLLFVRLTQDSSMLEQMLQDQYELLADKRAFLDARPTRRPAVGYYTSGFGVRKSPFGGRVKMHEGLDIANRPGTPIKATADGVVAHAESKAGYGQVVILDHGYGVETWYAHCRKLLVKKGQKVRRGDAVSLLGNSGQSTGPHLHYEVRVHGIPVDPLTYILEN
jgi:murein DD-endopeptidase MepM/ murein hydrolase activator NlpD